MVLCVFVWQGRDHIRTCVLLYCVAFEICTAEGNETHLHFPLLMGQSSDLIRCAHSYLHDKGLHTQRMSTSSNRLYGLTVRPVITAQYLRDEVNILKREGQVRYNTSTYPLK
jgi:hypothetical protein